MFNEVILSTSLQETASDCKTFLDEFENVLIFPVEKMQVIYELHSRRRVTYVRLVKIWFKYFGDFKYFMNLSLEDAFARTNSMRTRYIAIIARVLCAAPLLFKHLQRVAIIFLLTIR